MPTLLSMALEHFASEKMIKIVIIFALGIILATYVPSIPAAIKSAL